MFTNELKVTSETMHFAVILCPSSLSLLVVVSDEKKKNLTRTFAAHPYPKFAGVPPPRLLNTGKLQMLWSTTYF